MGQEEYSNGILGIGRSIKYNPQSALIIKDNKMVPDPYTPGKIDEVHKDNLLERQTSAMGLYYELGHTYDDFNKVKTEGTGGSYDNPKDANVILNYEQPASKILREPLRFNHDGTPFQSLGPTSTIPVIPIINFY